VPAAVHAEWVRVTLLLPLPDEPATVLPLLLPFELLLLGLPLLELLLLGLPMPGLLLLELLLPPRLLLPGLLLLELLLPELLLPELLLPELLLFFPGLALPPWPLPAEDAAEAGEEGLLMMWTLPSERADSAILASAFFL
jgi:hypothetical protein